MMKRFTSIAVTTIASAAFLTLPAHAGLLGGSGGLGGGIGGTFGNGGPGAIGGQLGIDGQANGRIARPDTTRATDAVDKAQGRARAVGDAAAQRAAETKGMADTKAAAAKDHAGAAAAQAARAPKADGALGTESRTGVSRQGVSADAGGRANASAQR